MRPRLASSRRVAPGRKFPTMRSLFTLSSQRTSTRTS